MTNRFHVAAILTVLTSMTAISAHATTPLPVPAGFQCDAYFLFPAPQTFGGPFFTLGQLDFRNPTSAGAPQTIQLIKRTEDLPGSPVVYVGFSSMAAGRTPLDATFPTRNFPQPRHEVWVELQHFASMKVTAFNAGGTVLGSQAPPSKTRVFLRFPYNVAHLRFEGSETLLYRICWR